MTAYDDYMAHQEPAAQSANPKADAQWFLQDGYNRSGLTAKDFEPTDANQQLAKERAVFAKATFCGGKTLQPYETCLDSAIDSFRMAVDMTPEGSATHVEARNALTMLVFERTYFNGHAQQAPSNLVVMQERPTQTPSTQQLIA